MPGDWIGQTAANSAMGVISLGKLSSVETLNDCREAGRERGCRRSEGDRVVLAEQQLAGVKNCSTKNFDLVLDR